MAAAPAVVVIGPLHADEQSLPFGPKAQSESFAQPTLADADAMAVPIAVLAAFDRSEHVAASGAPSPAVEDPVTPIEPASKEPASCAEPFVAPQAQNAATWTSHAAWVRSMTPQETARRVPADRRDLATGRTPSDKKVSTIQPSRSRRIQGSLRDDGSTRRRTSICVSAHAGRRSLSSPE